MSHAQLYKAAIGQARQPDSPLWNAGQMLLSLSRMINPQSLEPFLPRLEPLPLQPSSDPHDFVSIATYFWPNPDTADGMPWVRRDGEYSPDIGRYDRVRFDRAMEAMGNCAAAACLSDEQHPAKELNRIIESWFINPQTRVNPNLNHA